MPSTTETPATAAKGERRVRVIGERVACRRIGPTDLSRCAECVYLVRMGRRYVVCIEGEVSETSDFGW